MRLFISNSKSPAATHAKVICGISFAFLIALEGLSAYMLKHHSVTYRRVSQQLNRAVGARPAGTGEPASVVMIGNSLFLDGIQVDRLQELTSERLRIYPIFLEATGYYDRSEEHTSELQSRSDLVCRLLLEKKKNDII